MNKETFLRELEELLSEIPAEERDEALQYYRDFLEEAGSENEEEILRHLGGAGKVAEEIKGNLLEDDGTAGEFTERGYRDERFEEASHVPDQYAEIVKSGSSPETEEERGKGCRAEYQGSGTGEGGAWNEEEFKQRARNAWVDARNSEWGKKAEELWNSARDSEWGRKAEEAWYAAQEKAKQRRTQKNSGARQDSWRFEENAGDSRNTGKSDGKDWYTDSNGRETGRAGSHPGSGYAGGFGGGAGSTGADGFGSGAGSTGTDGFGSEAGSTGADNFGGGAGGFGAGRRTESFSGGSGASGRHAGESDDGFDNGSGKPVKRQENRNGILFLLLFLFFGIPLAGKIIGAGFSLIGAFFGAVFGIFGGLFGLIAGAIAAAVGAFTAGIAMIVTGFCNMATPAIGVMVVGFGFFALAVSFLLAVVVRWGCVVAVPGVFRFAAGIVRWCCSFVSGLVHRIFGRGGASR